MGGALLLFAAGAAGRRLSATITAAQLDISPDVYGYGTVIYVGGSMDDDDYVDGSGNTRTISHIFNDVTNNLVYFYLNGTSIPDNDQTFSRIVLEGVSLNRADATYTASDGGSTLWLWSGVTGDPMNATGAHSLEVWA